MKTLHTFCIPSTPYPNVEELWIKVELADPNQYDVLSTALKTLPALRRLRLEEGRPIGTWPLSVHIAWCGATPALSSLHSPT